MLRDFGASPVYAGGWSMNQDNKDVLDDRMPKKRSYGLVAKSNDSCEEMDKRPR
jgi:hypothetical protein